METRTELIAELERVLREYAPEHDVDGIADDLHLATGAWSTAGVTTGRFWEIVRAHALTLTVTFDGREAQPKGLWTVSTDASGDLESGTFEVVEDLAESETALGRSLAIAGFRFLGSGTVDGDLVAYHVERVRE